jgi:putative ABC transport system ATP-binding protein
LPSEPGAVAAACRDVDRTYVTATGQVPALRGVSAELRGGELTVIAGPSGSGKSSLLRILGCIERPDAGTVTVGGREVAGLGARARRRLRRTEIAYVFQEPAENLLSYLTAAEHVALAVRLRGRRAPGDDELLERLGLGHRRDHHPATLSGGEQQRLAFAAAVAGGPALVVADEPTAELERASGRRLLDAVRALRAAGTSFVVSSHDPQVAAAADTVIRLRGGRVVA